MDTGLYIRLADQLLHELQGAEPEQVIAILARRLAQADQVGVQGMSKLRSYAPEGWHAVCHCDHTDITAQYEEEKGLWWEVDRKKVREVIDAHFEARHERLRKRCAERGHHGERYTHSRTGKDMCSDCYTQM